MNVNNLLDSLAKAINDKTFIIDSNANIQNSVTFILLAKTGAIKNLSLIQSIIIASEVYELVKQKLMYCDAYFLSQNEKQLLNRLIYNKSLSLAVKTSLE